jgi:hypothetical protein
MTIKELWEKYLIEAEDIGACLGDGAHKILNLNLLDLTIGQFIFTLVYIGFNIYIFTYHYEEIQAKFDEDIKDGKLNSTFETIKFWLFNISTIIVLIVAFYGLLLIGDSFRK